MHTDNTMYMIMMNSGFFSLLEFCEEFASFLFTSYATQRNVLSNPLLHRFFAPRDTAKLCGWVRSLLLPYIHLQHRSKFHLIRRHQILRLIRSVDFKKHISCETTLRSFPLIYLKYGSFLSQRK